MILLLFLFGVFFICMAMLWTEGLWGNALTLVNVIVAGMLATSYWEPLARSLEEQMPSFTYVLDIISVWLIFFLAMGFLRGMTAYLSKYKVRFHRLVESLGNIALSVAVALTMTLFAGWTLHLAPLAPEPFRGADLRSSSLANAWGGAMHFAARNTMGAGDAGALQSVPSRYYQRRQALSQLEGFRVGGY